MEKYFLGALTLILVLLAPACSNSQVYLDVMEGNYAFSRGEYEEANMAYLNARGTDLYNEYITYNLGNVYYALGEIDSAFVEWESIREDVKLELNIKSLFNTGVLLFELSRFEEAYNYFRNILELDPSNVKAKINLEYCIQKMNFESENKNSSRESIILKESNNKEDAGRVLDFVRRRETTLWKAPTGPGSDKKTLRDY